MRLQFSFHVADIVGGELQIIKLSHSLRANPSASAKPSLRNESAPKWLHWPTSLDSL